MRHFLLLLWFFRGVIKMLAPGQIWFVRSKNDDDPEVELVEIVYLNGNVVGFGDAYYDLRLLDFVARDYEEEEQRAQEKFMEKIRSHDEYELTDDMLGSTDEPTAFADVPEKVGTIPADLFNRIPTKPSWWSRWGRFFRVYRVFTWNYF